MNYAVVQKDLEPPRLDQLRAAFREVHGLTEIDAHMMGNDAFGVLVKGFDADRAQSLAAALARQGFASEVVAESELPELPQARQVHRFDCLPDALLIYDPLNRSFPLPWANVLMIAAGKVPMVEFERVEKPVFVLPQISPYSPYRINDQYTTRTVRQTEEALPNRLLLEVIITGAALRYCVIADHSRSLFNGLGDRRTCDLDSNFALLVQDIIAQAPGAALNRGAYYFRENSAKPFIYPNKSAFYREMTWLLWKLAGAQPAA